MWIFLVLVYGILKGIRDICKKKALTISGVTEVLFVYTLLAFVFTVPSAGKFTGVPVHEMHLVAFKSFIIFIAFLCSFYAIEKMPISLYGVLDLSRMLFAMILGVVVLKETLGITQIVAMILVAGGLLMLKYKPRGKVPDSDASPTELRVSPMILVLAFVSTFLNAVSGIMDKILMGGGNISSGQLQFWYMFFMLLYYGIYVLATRTKIHWKSVLANPYVWVISVLFVIADRCLFVANGYAGSKVTIMTLLKQICCIVTIVGGKLIFKERDTLKRFICAVVIIAGIVISAL